MAKILIAGGTGLVGKAICNKFVAAKHEVVLLSRNPKSNALYPTFHWDPMKGKIDEKCMDGVDYVINLAGAGIADQRWTTKRKQLIIESRSNSAHLLGKIFKNYRKPKKYLAASAIGYYGNSGSTLVSESSPSGNGFLSESVIKWEAASRAISNIEVPVQIFRIGIVLSMKGGALPKMAATYPFKIGNYFGDGSQIYSWIHIADLANIFLHFLNVENQPKIINAVAPNPVSNKIFAKAINTAGNYKAFVFSAPILPIKILLGEMAAVVLDSTNVSNQALLKTGFKFEWPEIQAALKDIIENKK